MVVHDREREQAWILQRQTRSREKNRHTFKRTKRVSVLAMQSVVCVVVLLMALLFRVAGGEAYTRLQEGFSNALEGNELMVAILQLWDGNPAETAPLPNDSGVKDSGLTSHGALP